MQTKAQILLPSRVYGWNAIFSRVGKYEAQERTTERVEEKTLRVSEGQDGVQERHLPSYHR